MNDRLKSMSVLAVLAPAMLLYLSGFAIACPFCSAVSQTFSEEMQAMDVVLFAELIESPPDDAEDESGELPRCKFKILEIVNGDAWYAEEDEIEVHYFGSSSGGETFLIMGTDPPRTMWGTPLVISDRVQTYLQSLTDLPPGTERLEFFINYLEDEDELLARDAYDEFAKTNYDGVIALKDSMDRDTLVGWIRDPDISPSRRRLYLTMLGVCGTRDDCALLEEMMQSEDREDKAGLNALIACYLSLAGAEGLPLIEELFLANQEAEYADTYAAIMALRFHGNDNDLIPRQQLLPGMRAVLDRADLADLVIPDLARWEDWEVMPELIALFKNAAPDSNWVRVPVINYMRACANAPQPPEEGSAESEAFEARLALANRAQQAIEELKEIDAEAVERANSFFPFTQFAGPDRNATDDNQVATSDVATSDSADSATTEADPALVARQAVAPKMVPRDRTIIEDPPPAPAQRKWLPPAIFGSLLFVALLLRWVTRGSGQQVSSKERSVRQ